MLSERKAAEIAFPKLYSACMDCGAVQLKRKMTTVYLRAPGDTPLDNRPVKTMGCLCTKCMQKMRDRFGVEVP